MLTLRLVVSSGSVTIGILDNK